MPIPVVQEEVYGAETWYRELGYYITSRKEQYERACKYFDIAVDQAPENKRTLLGRSIARAKAVQYEGALADIKNALEVQPDCLVSQAQKSLYTYLNCNFEDALVSNLAITPLRKKPDSAVLGVMHCHEAIENCVGMRAGRPLRDHFKIIRKLAWKKAKELSQPYVYKPRRKKKRKVKRIDETKHDALVPLHKRKRPGAVESDPNLKIYDSLYSHKEAVDNIPPGPPFPYRPLQEYTTNIENYMAAKYLESMYLDKIFLKDVKDNDAIVNCNDTSSRKILQILKHGYKALSYKQELLRIRRPFYFIKYQEINLLSPTLWAKQMKEDAKIRLLVQADAKALLAKIENYIENKHTRMALETAEKLKLMCEVQHKKYFPDRGEYLKKIYKLVAKAHLDLKRLNPNGLAINQDRRIYNMLGYPISAHVSRDSILREFKDVFIDWKKQISIAEKRLLKARDAEELAWLYHDLSRYHTEIKQYELGRVYARKCIAEAKECDEINWVINATLLIVRINMQLRNKTDAKQELQSAIEVAETMDNSSLREYLRRTMEIVEDFCFEDANSKIHEKREKQIISVMSTAEQKSEIEHIFRLMSVMPSARRMSVMPGVPFPKEGRPKGKTSIMPTKSTDDVHLPKSMVNTTNVRPVDPPGGMFLQLMQFHLD